ncbi:TIGR00295 family protein [Methanobrevibacter sp.]|uniref:TIGR00295 family protein n=1 Tax=Methanobrevibacter sp. TaxID=66852 RepID=UPI003863EFDF
MNREIELLKKENTPQNVIEHSKAVCLKAMKIAANFENANRELICKGSLLHDIGRSRTHGITHAVRGVEVAREYGYGEDVLNIIERHIGAGITESEAKKLGLPEKSYVPQTLEEKIVAHADNLISGSEEVDIDFVIEKWKRRIDEPDDNIKRLIELDNELIKAFEE